LARRKNKQKLPLANSYNNCAKKPNDGKMNVLAKRHYGWWRCDFLAKSMAHLITTWQHLKSLGFG